MGPSAIVQFAGGGDEHEYGVGGDEQRQQDRGGLSSPGGEDGDRQYAKGGAAGEGGTLGRFPGFTLRDASLRDAPLDEVFGPDEVLDPHGEEPGSGVSNHEATAPAAFKS